MNWRRKARTGANTTGNSPANSRCETSWAFARQRPLPRRPRRTRPPRIRLTPPTGRCQPMTDAALLFDRLSRAQFTPAEINSLISVVATPPQARMSDYFGVWAYEPDRFWSQWKIIGETDMARHLAM